MDDFGSTAMEWCFFFGNKEGMMALLDGGADSSIGEGDGVRDEPCGCMELRNNPRLLQCPEGTCQTVEQIAELEMLMGRGSDGTGVTASNSPPAPPEPRSESPSPNPKTSGNVPVLMDEPTGEDCSSFPDLIAQLECVAAGE